MADGGTAVIDVDHEHADAGGRGREEARAEAAHGRAKRRGHPARRRRAIDGFAQALTLEHAGQALRREAAAGRRLPGRERAGRGRACDRDRRRARRGVRRAGVAARAPGRLELVGERNGAPIFVDYAHTPDALDKALEALRPYVKRELIVVFGCGGDRDPGKRPLMGAIAARDGRSRHRHRRQSAQRGSGRDPRRDPRGGARRARDRRPPRGDPRGRRRAAAGRRPADRRQGPRDRPDRRRPDAAVHRSRRAACGARRRRHERVSALWTVEAMAAAMGARASGRAAGWRSAACRSTRRTHRPGDAFFALRPTCATATTSSPAALKARRGPRGGRRSDKRRDDCRRMRRC